jgi:Tol biopolymer transport system component
MRRKGHLLLTLGLFFLIQAGGICWSQTTERISLGPGGIEGNDASTDPSISSDGMHVAFMSFATNLVAGGTNGKTHIFVRERQTGITTLVSVDSAGTEGNGDSSAPSISGDGRYVAFVSDADNLVGGDSNGFFDIFVHDLQSGATTRVSVDSGGGEGDGPSFNPSISEDGRYVAFDSDADLVLPDVWGVYEIYVHDRTTGATERVSVDSTGSQGNNHSYSPSISGDGRYVAFESAADNLVAGDTPFTMGGFIDIFVHDRTTGATTRVSVDSLGGEGNGESSAPSISADGRYVAFQSDATNLVAGDTNGSTDIFIHDRDTDRNGTYDEVGGTSTARVSVDSFGTEGDGESSAPSISADGRYVAFQSDASNLVPGDTNGSTDIFIHDRDTDRNGTYDEVGGTSTARVSVASGGDEGNGDSSNPSICADARYVAFDSDAYNLVDGDTSPPMGFPDIFVHDPDADGSGATSASSSGSNSGCFIDTLVYEFR